ncbi:MAG: hypothetical protein MZV65_01550 [Chromatiales bacterium]|nr:hypothetical protein [Chromatiales bacterium]
MSLPFGHAETTFESFLQELPEDYWELAIEFKALYPVAQDQDAGATDASRDVLLRPRSGAAGDGRELHVVGGADQRYGDPLAA